MDALGHLGKRVCSHECLLWVDATCINQDDLAERSSQVRQMTTIYESSERIFAWLGVPFSKAETKLAVKMMHDCHICLRDGLAENGLTSLLATIDSKHPYFPSKLHLSTRTAWNGITDMFGRPYFWRVWIYQGASTPRPIDFYCGIFRFDDILLGAAISFAMGFSQFKGFCDTYDYKNVGAILF
jgi:hypothetical protein